MDSSEQQSHGSVQAQEGTQEQQPALAGLPGTELPFPLAVYLHAMGQQCQVQRGLEPRRPLVLACGVEQTRKWGERPQHTVPTPAKQTCKRTKV